MGSGATLLNVKKAASGAKTHTRRLPEVRTLPTRLPSPFVVASGSPRSVPRSANCTMRVTLSVRSWSRPPLYLLPCSLALGGAVLYSFTERGCCLLEDRRQFGC